MEWALGDAKCWALFLTQEVTNGRIIGVWGGGLGVIMGGVLGGKPGPRGRERSGGL